MFDDGNKCVEIFLDLDKGFDMVQHNMPLYKLENLGMRGIATNLMKSYRTVRKQRIILKKIPCRYIATLNMM